MQICIQRYTGNFLFNCSRLSSFSTRHPSQIMPIFHAEIARVVTKTGAWAHWMFANTAVNFPSLTYSIDKLSLITRHSRCNRISFISCFSSNQISLNCFLCFSHLYPPPPNTVQLTHQWQDQPSNSISSAWRLRPPPNLRQTSTLIAEEAFEVRTNQHFLSFIFFFFFLLVLLCVCS